MRKTVQSWEMVAIFKRSAIYAGPHCTPRFWDTSAPSFPPSLLQLVHLFILEGEAP